MYGLEILSWMAVGVLIGGAYAWVEKQQLAFLASPVIAGGLGGLFGAWLSEVFLPASVLEGTYRPILLGFAALGSLVLIGVYEVYRRQASPHAV